MIIILIVLFLAALYPAVHLTPIGQAFSQLAILFLFTFATLKVSFTAFSITFLFLSVFFPFSI